VTYGLLSCPCEGCKTHCVSLSATGTVQPLMQQCRCFATGCKAHIVLQRGSALEVQSALESVSWQFSIGLGIGVCATQSNGRSLLPCKAIAQRTTIAQRSCGHLQMCEGPYVTYCIPSVIGLC
jgi:hypothetical protein